MPGCPLGRPARERCGGFFVVQRHLLTRTAVRSAASDVRVMTGTRVDMKGKRFGSWRSSARSVKAE